MRTLSFPLIIVATIIGRPAVSQQTWIVDAQMRSGWQFTAIQPAVQAAGVGDTLLVRDGSYAGATVGKGLYLLAQGAVELNTDLVVGAIPAGQRVVIKGFTMRDLLNRGGRPVICAASPGTIHFERMTMAGSMWGPGLSVTDCAHVSALDCTLDAGASQFPVFPPRTSAPGPGIVVRRSAILLNRCSGNGACILSGQAQAFVGNAGCMVAESTRAILVNCRLQGGDAPCVFALCSYVPTPALSVSNGSTVVTRATTYVGGSYLQSPCSCPLVAGVHADGTSTVVADPGTTFTMSGGGALVPQALADLQKTSPSPSRVLTLALSSPTPGPYGTFASFAAAPVPFPPVDIWLDPPQAILLFSGTVNGVQFDSMTIPPFVPSGLPAAFQSVLLVNNRAEVSTPLVVVLD